MSDTPVAVTLSNVCQSLAANEDEEDTTNIVDSLPSHPLTSDTVQSIREYDEISEIQTLMTDTHTYDENAIYALIVRTPHTATLLGFENDGWVVVDSSDVEEKEVKYAMGSLIESYQKEFNGATF